MSVILRCKLQINVKIAMCRFVQIFLCCVSAKYDLNWFITKIKWVNFLLRHSLVRCVTVVVCSGMHCITCNRRSCAGAFSWIDMIAFVSD